MTVKEPVITVEPLIVVLPFIVAVELAKLPMTTLLAARLLPILSVPDDTPRYAPSFIIIPPSVELASKLIAPTLPMLMVAPVLERVSKAVLPELANTVEALPVPP